MTGSDRSTDPPARAEVLIDNEVVRVVRYTIEPGTRVAWHRHSHAYLVTPLTSGRLVLDDGHGQTVAMVEAGQPAFHAAGIEHEISNPGPETVVYIDAELKDA